MDAILSSVKDIIKFKAVSYVNTGDKTFDNLINTLLLTIIAILFTKEYYANIVPFVSYWYYKSIPKPTKLTIDNVEQYEHYFNSRKNHLKFVSWWTCDDKEFTEHFCQYVFYVDTMQAHNMINMKTMEIKFKKDPIDHLRQILESHQNVIYPVYVGKDGLPIGIKLFDHTIYIVYEQLRTLKEFITTVREFHPKINGKQSNQQICEPEEEDDEAITQSGSTIYSDRTFDMVVSKHKSGILNYLNDFKSNLVEENRSKFNGFGSYNFGLILHGKPGTGKTSIIKAICNDLRRDILLLNMSTIKTTKTFKKLFRDNSKYVIVLEEIDCVEGILTRSNDQKQQSDELKELKERQLELLRMRGQGVKKDNEKDSNNPLDDELENVQEAIAKWKDRLSLYTFLTVLDGMDEMRGRVIIATTNHIERIDPALLRPGRFDLKLKLEEFTAEETKELLHKMFRGSVDEHLIDDAKFPHMKYTPVEIINLCHVHHSLKEVVRIMCHEPDTMVVCSST